MTPAIKTIVLLLISNCFMLSAWYLHLNLKWLDNKTLFIASILSWGIAFFEYLFHIPTNRIGDQVFNLGQLQLLQIVISLILFVPFSIFVMGQKWNWDYVIAAMFIGVGAYFIFRSKF